MKISRYQLFVLGILVGMVWALVLTTIAQAQTTPGVCCRSGNCATPNAACNTPVAGSTPCDYAGGYTSCPSSECAASASVVAAPDCKSSFLAVWLLDEASGTRDNAEGTAANDLSDGNTVLNDSVNKIEGTAAALFDKTANEYLYCANATCTEISQRTAATSFGGWHRAATDNQQMISIRNIGTAIGISTMGFNLRDYDGNYFTCMIADAGGDVSVNSSTNPTTATWYHVSCTWAPGDNVRVYVRSGADIATVTASASTQDSMAASTAPAGLSSEITTRDWDGQLDEMWVYPGQLTAAGTCYLCSCGTTNDAACTGTEGGAFSDTGRNATLCGGCALPTFSETCATLLE